MCGQLMAQERTLFLFWGVLGVEVLFLVEGAILDEGFMLSDNPSLSGPTYFVTPAMKAASEGCRRVRLERHRLSE